MKGSHQSSSQSRRPQGKAHTKRNSRVTMDDPQTDFYSPNNHSSDSEEDRPFKLVEPSLSSAPHEWGAKHRGKSQCHILWIAPP